MALWNFLIKISLAGKKSLNSIPGTEKPTCSGPRKEWRNMVVDAEFPISIGSEVALECPEVFFSTGDSTVTCLEGTQFYFNTEPTCERELLHFTPSVTCHLLNCPVDCKRL